VQSLYQGNEFNPQTIKGIPAVEHLAWISNPIEEFETTSN